MSFFRTDIEHEYQKSLDKKKTRSGVFLLYKENDDFLPCSAEYVEDIIDSVASQEQRLRERFGIEAKVGIELEFIIYEHSVGKNADYWKKIKEKIVSDLKVASLDCEAAEKFGPRETMFFDMLHLDKRTKNILEPLPFNEYTSSTDTNPMELQLRYCNPVRIIENLKTLSEVLYDKMTREYGLVFAENTDPVFHINFSFWDRQGNLLDSNHPEFQFKGKAIIDEMLRALYDSLHVQLDDLHLTSAIDECLGIRVDRYGFARYARGRLEIRPTNLRELDPHLFISVGLAGSEYGIETLPVKGVSDKTYMKSSYLIQKASLTQTVERGLTTTKHLVNGSIVQNDNEIRIPEEIIRYKASALAVGLLNIEPDWGLNRLISREIQKGREEEYIKRLKIILQEEYGEHLKEKLNLVELSIIFNKANSNHRYISDFFHKINIKRNGNQNCFQIIWPETSEGQYKFTIKGEDTLGKESIEFAIDINRLKANMPEITTYPAFVNDGYPLNEKMEAAKDMLKGYQQRLSKSKVLKKLNPEILTRMIEELDTRISKIAHEQ